MSMLRAFGRWADSGRLCAIVLTALVGLMPTSNGAAATINSYAKATPITIVDNAPASLYPSKVTVSGVTQNTITKVSVILSDFNHTFPDDVDILLVAPDGTRSIVMSDAGGNNDNPASHLTLTFSATASTAIPDEDPISDSAPIRPANYAARDASLITDVFPSPGPGTVVMDPADFDAFNGVNPNGDWSLFVIDDSEGDSGSILGGWTLQLTVPTVYTVTKTADTNDGICNGDCSLREAIAAAGDGDLIRFASPLFDASQTITLSGTPLSITKSVTIEGPGADKLAISGNFASRIFNVANDLAVTLKGMTIRDGRDDIGAAILSPAQLTLDHVAMAGNKTTGNGLGGAVYLTRNGNFVGCTFSDNDGLSGGAIFFAQPAQILRLVNTTISGNRAHSGGGIDILSGNASLIQLDMIDSTLADNLVPPGGVGGGIYAVTSNGGDNIVVTLRNSIIANNAVSNILVDDLVGTISVKSLGFNLTNDATSPYLVDPTDVFGDPMLGPLNNNGGHVETRALLGGSPALDTGHSSGYPRDVRGQSRSFDSVQIDAPGDYSDIGAAEMHALFVNTTADGDTGSLRQALTLANANSPQPVDILFDPNVFGATPQTINLASALPVIGTSLSIHGPGAQLLTVRRDTGGDYPVLSTNAAIEVAMTGLTISNGHGDAGGIQSFSRLSLAQVTVSGNMDIGGYGGGGLGQYFAGATIRDSTFDHNTSTAKGGGIFAQGVDNVFRLSNVTISDNQAPIGSAIEALNQDPATSVLDVVNSTIANNTATSGSGGIEMFTQVNPGASFIARLRNSIVAGNTLPNLAVGTSGGGDGGIVSRGFNLTNDNNNTYLNQANDKINANPLLGPLAYNGGSTRTLALQAGSPAIDAGDSSGSIRDQRGFTRPYDQPGSTNVSDGSDIGAFERDDTLFRNGFDG